MYISLKMPSLHAARIAMQNFKTETSHFPNPSAIPNPAPTAWAIWGKPLLSQGDTQREKRSYRASTLAIHLPRHSTTNGLNHAAESSQSVLFQGVKAHHPSDPKRRTGSDPWSCHSVTRASRPHRLWPVHFQGVLWALDLGLTTRLQRAPRVY